MSKQASYLALPPDLSGPWAFCDTNGQVSSLQSDEQKTALGAVKDLILVLAGENVRRFHLDLGGLKGAELRSAIEFELEERMGGSLSAELICQDRRQPSDVALISNDYSAALSALIDRYNLSPAKVVIDYELLGELENIHVGERYIKGGVEGFVADKDWVSILPNMDDFKPTEPQALFAKFREALSHDNAQLFDLKAGLKLGGGSSFMWTRWAKVAAIAAALIIVPVLLDRSMHARAFERQAAEDRAATRTLYQEATGQTPNDVARDLTRQLKGSQSSAGFIDMSAVLFAAMSDIDGVEVDTMRYDVRQNVLQLSIRYPSFDAGAQLEQAVSTRGGNLTLGGIRERGDNLIGEASFSLTSGGGS